MDSLIVEVTNLNFFEIFANLFMKLYELIFCYRISPPEGIHK